MNQATITKVLKAVENADAEWTIGFKRLNALPKKMRLNFQVACHIENREGNCHLIAKEFLAKLTDQEFVTWLKVNSY